MLNGLSSRELYLLSKYINPVADTRLKATMLGENQGGLDKLAEHASQIMQNDEDDELTEPEMDGPFYKNQTIHNFLVSAPETDRERVRKQMHRVHKAPYFGKLAEKSEREKIRQRDIGVYGGNMSDSDSSTRIARLDALIKDAKSKGLLHDYFINKTIKVINVMRANRQDEMSFNFGYHRARLQGYVTDDKGHIVIHITSVAIPHELRGDDTIGKYLDYFIDFGFSIEIHTIIGPAMAAIAFNRGFHVYNNEHVANFVSLNDDLRRHSIRAQDWTFNHSELNTLLREKRHQVKILKLEYNDQDDLISDENERRDLARIMTGPEMTESARQSTLTDNPTYNWRVDASNPNSGVAYMYRRAGVPNPFLQ
jgi:hypothetical protein